MNEAGLLVITAFISPYRSHRSLAREIVGHERFLEVFVDAPLAVCEARDVKGLYKKARAGQLPAFTGVSDPYESPDAPELRLPTDSIACEAAVDRIVELMERREVIRKAVPS
jgi:adenylylsulfate kinase-like enzyme